MITRFPFSSTLYVEFAGRFVLTALTAAIIFCFSFSLTLLGSATSTFSPATGSYFLAVSITVILRSLVTTFPFLFLRRKVTTTSPAGCCSCTVPPNLFLTSLNVSVPVLAK